MRFFIFIFLFICLTKPGFAQTDLCMKSTEGTDFWFGFMEGRNYIKSHQIKIAVTASETANFTVSIGRNGEIFNQSYTVNGNSSIQITIPWNLGEATGSEEIQNKGIHLVSDMPVRVYALDWDRYSSDVAAIYPVDALGMEYYAMCYYPNIDESNPESGSGKNSEFLIVASEDQTTIKITPSKVTDKLFPNDSTFEITLNKGEVYQVQSQNIQGTEINGQGDLTGSHILADKPVAFYSGALSTTVPYGVCCWDHLYEQIPPVYSWGRKYFTVPLKTRQKDIYRIVAAENNTLVQISGEQNFNLNAGEFYEFQLYQNDVRQIFSDKPILVAQFSLSNDADTTFTKGNADPFMLILNSSEQWINEATFVNFEPPQNELDTSYFGIQKHFVNIMAPTNVIPDILLDGRPVQSEFKPFSDPDFSFAQIETNPGTHRIENTGSGEGLYAYIYGFGKWESYGYSAGYKLNKILDLGENIEFFIKDTMLLCYGDSIVLDAGAHFDSWLWYDGSTNQTLTVKDAGWYSVKTTTLDGCIQEDSVYVKLSHPETNLDDEIINECYPYSISLSGNDGYENYLWQNEFGATLSTQQTIVANQTGEYRITVFDKYKCTASDKMKLTVFPVPEVKIEGDTLVCGVDTTSLKVSISGAPEEVWNLEGNYIWSAGNNLVSVTEQTRTHAKIEVAEWGNYSVYYQLETVDGCLVFDTIRIRFHQQPEALFSFEDDSQCEGYSKILDFSASSATDSATFIWDLDGCQFTDTLESRKYSVSLGAFLNRQPQIQLTINDNGCISNTFSEVLGAKPNFVMEADNRRGCDELTVNFSSRLLTDDNVEFVWTLDDAEVIKEQNFQKFYSDTGFHKVNLTVANLVTQCTNGFTIDSMIKVFPTPTAKITADPNECYPDSALISYTNTIDSSFCYWEFSGIHQIGNGNDSILVVIDDPTGIAKLTVNEYGCISQPVEMELKRKPHFDFYVDSREGCQPYWAQVFANSMDRFLTLFWITDSLPYPTDVSHIYHFPETGKFEVAMAGLSSETGCSDTLIKTDWIWIHPKPYAKFEPDFPVALLENARITFTNYSELAALYYWDFDDGETSQEFEPVHTYSEIGEYNPQLISTSEFGCADTFSYAIKILPSTLYVPNAFRPNSDILENRTFMPAGVGVDENRFNLKIYDRWGQLVFESNTPYSPWDGKNKNGDDAPIGNYVWVTGYYDIQGYEHNKKGQVLLMR